MASLLIKGSLLLAPFFILLSLVCRLEFGDGLNPLMLMNGQFVDKRQPAAFAFFMSLNADHFWIPANCWEDSASRSHTQPASVWETITVEEQH